MKKITGLFLTAALFAVTPSTAQSTWLAELHREDGIRIPFHFTARSLNDPAGWVIRNAAEKIRLKQFETSGDSLIVPMPVFESRFIVQRKGSTLVGRWEKGGAYRTVSMPFTATPAKSRFQPGKAPVHFITARWQEWYRAIRSCSPPLTEAMPFYLPPVSAVKTASVADDFIQAPRVCKTGRQRKTPQPGYQQQPPPCM